MEDMQVPYATCSSAPANSMAAFILAPTVSGLNTADGKNIAGVFVMAVFLTHADEVPKSSKSTEAINTATPLIVSGNTIWIPSSFLNTVHFVCSNSRKHAHACSRMLTHVHARMLEHVRVSNRGH